MVMVVDVVVVKQSGEEIFIVEVNEISDFKFGGDLVVLVFFDGQIVYGGCLGMFGE